MILYLHTGKQALLILCRSFTPFRIWVWGVVCFGGLKDGRGNPIEFGASGVIDSKTYDQVGHFGNYSAIILTIVLAGSRGI